LTERRIVTVDGVQYEVDIEMGEENWEVSIDGKTYIVEVEGVVKKPRRAKRKTKSFGSSSSGVVSSAIPGKIVEILVSEGDEIRAGSIVIVLEAMKMQNEIKAPIDGRIKKVICKPGERIEANVPLLEIEKEDKGE